MSEIKEDRRVQRTRALLVDALLDLMIEKGYEAITVQDIIDRANVGRSTFYSHFSDKEQLLLGSIDQLELFLKQQRAVRVVPDPLSGITFGFSLPMLQHVQGNKRLYTATVGKQSGAAVLHHMKCMLSDLVRDEAAGLGLDPKFGELPHEIAVEHIVNTFLTLLQWWMGQNTPCSAEEMDRVFHKLTLSGISVFSRAEFAAFGKKRGEPQHFEP
ncbi:TetR/AcrR family transcriptional regulator [Paenibacillus beijingensis]|uniref:TetR/AcrR family transcriptional regulator n=1 Tax=Paenibacillus beijingensis TaxID=1126833 RepID=UPI000698B9A2|nr:TetR/AcrR family transcriptional regulator [Paenibacillus beijingensis]